jgi:hypothetical protein
MLKIIKNLGSREIGNKGQKRGYSLVECECGNKFELQTYRINKVTKQCKSCSSTTHGLRNHRLYSIYDHMIQRTENPNSSHFKHYGKRGITICQEWRKNFVCFYVWAINNGYKDNLTIDRIDVNGNYEPSNCRWTDNFTQARNTRVLRSNNTSGYRGVYKNGNSFVARITVNYKFITIGSFKTAIEAAKAYDQYVIDNMLEHNVNFN